MTWALLRPGRARRPAPSPPGARRALAQWIRRSWTRNTINGRRLWTIADMLEEVPDGPA